MPTETKTHIRLGQVVAPWSPEDCATLEKLTVEGVKIREIAHALGRTVRATHAMRSRLGLIGPKFGGKRPKPGVDPANRTHWGKKWIPAEDQMIGRLANRKMPIPEMAKLLNRTEKSVTDRLKSLGWTKPVHGGARHALNSFGKWREVDIGIQRPITPQNLATGQTERYKPKEILLASVVCSCSPYQVRIIRLASTADISRAKCGLCGKVGSLTRH
jgi:hypothetical protein